MEQIAGEFTKSRYYSILGDEATGCSLKELLVLIFRFADKENNIREEFVSFLEWTYGVSGQSLHRTINAFLDSLDIDISDSRGQGCDGAETVAGKNQRLSADALRVNPKSLCKHHYFHHFNLAVVVSCGKQFV